MVHLDLVDVSDVNPEFHFEAYGGKAQKCIRAPRNHQVTRLIVAQLFALPLGVPLPVCVLTRLEAAVVQCLHVSLDEAEELLLSVAEPLLRPQNLNSWEAMLLKIYFDPLSMKTYLVSANSSSILQKHIMILKNSSL